MIFAPTTESGCQPHPALAENGGHKSMKQSRVATLTMRGCRNRQTKSRLRDFPRFAAVTNALEFNDIVKSTVASQDGITFDMPILRGERCKPLIHRRSYVKSQTVCKCGPCDWNRSTGCDDFGCNSARPGSGGGRQRWWWLRWRHLPAGYVDTYTRSRADWSGDYGSQSSPALAGSLEDLPRSPERAMIDRKGD